MQKPRDQKRAENTQSVKDQTKTTASKERDTDGVDEKSRAGNVTEAEQTGTFLLGDLFVSAKGDGRFGADGESADQPHDQGTGPRAADAKQASHRLLT